MKDKPEQTDRNCVLENTGYPNKEIRMHAPGSSGPQPKGNQGEFSEKSGFKDVYCPWLAFLFFLKKLLAWCSRVSVFWGNYACVGCIRMFGVRSQLVREDPRSCRSESGEDIVYFDVCVTGVDLSF